MGEAKNANSVFEGEAKNANSVFEGEAKNANSVFEGEAKNANSVFEGEAKNAVDSMRFFGRSQKRLLLSHGFGWGYAGYEVGWSDEH